jgi:hypothetical protein
MSRSRAGQYSVARFLLSIASTRLAQRRHTLWAKVF